MTYRQKLVVSDSFTVYSDTLSLDNVFVQNKILKTTLLLLDVMMDFEEYSLPLRTEYFDLTYTWTTSPLVDLVVVIHDPC